ncbi:MAG: NAD(P)-dependent oxidoreductase [Vicinamibacterales bacterium]
MTVNQGSRSRIVVISDSFHTIPEAVATLSNSGHEVTYVHGLTPWTELDGADGHALANAHAIVMGRVPSVDAAAFALAPQVRIVALHTSGSDTVDVGEATRRGVVVTTVKGVNAEQCAEFAMGLLLCVVRQIDRGDRAIRAGQWVSGTHTSMDVYGSTLGIVGLGRIGRAFVRRALAFGMKVIAHTRTPDMALADELDIEYMPLDDVLGRADVIGLFASLSASTKGMIGARELGLMKRSAYLINIARGELIDQGALIEALRTRQIAGAGLDVFEVEPLYTSPLFELDNVVLTPHQAGLTSGAKARAAVRAARNALDGLAGTVPPDAINPHAFMTGESR